MIKLSSYEQLPLEFGNSFDEEGATVYPELSEDNDKLLNDVFNEEDKDVAVATSKEIKSDYEQMMLDFEGKEEIMEDIIKTHFLRLSDGETIEDIDHNEIKKVLSQLENDKSTQGLKSMKDYYFQDFVEDFKQEVQRELELKHDADYEKVAQAIGDLFQDMQEVAPEDKMESFSLSREIMHNLFFKAFVVDLDSFDPNKNLISFF